MIKVMIVCVFGQCFNPLSITTMEQRSRSCFMYFIQDQRAISLNSFEEKCTDVAAEINKQLEVKEPK